jgi:hypothetical protein
MSGVFFQVQSSTFFSRFGAKHGLTWSSVVLWSVLLCAAVAGTVWFRSFVWQKWEKQKLEREREERIMRLNKLKHLGLYEEVEQAEAVKQPPAVVSFAEVKEQILASQVPLDAVQKEEKEDRRELLVFGDEDDVMLTEEEERVSERGVFARLMGLGKKEVRTFCPEALCPFFLSLSILGAVMKNERGGRNHSVTHWRT